MLNLKELCHELSISLATGQNWLRLGKISPTGIEEGQPCFSAEDAEEIRRALADAKGGRLQSRRNKSQVSGLEIYTSYLGDNAVNQEVLPHLYECFTEEFLQRNCLGILRHYAKSLLQQAGLPESLAVFPGQSAESLSESERLPSVFLVQGQDFLGYLYLSLQSRGIRKANGAYYTPTRIVYQLIESLDVDRDIRILDPCCGTGNFLLALRDKPCDADRIYGQERDPVAAAIARINLALAFQISDPVFLQKHIREGDSLTDWYGKSWDLILGNPPWGLSFTEKKKRMLKRNFDMASGKRVDSAAVFLEQSLYHTEEGGRIAFVLPEALLQVSSHRKLRERMLEQAVIERADFVGNPFSGVFCPSVLLTLRKGKKSDAYAGIFVEMGGICWRIRDGRKITADNFYLTMTDEEYDWYKKIEELPEACYLKGQADFAIGIVTGDNRKWLQTQEEEGHEPILRGTDISAFQIQAPSAFIRFCPEQYQQIAATEFYRAPEKLVYRFVCNRLQVACDRERRLTLNSCNIVIPRIPGLKMEYIMAVLNSEVLQFYWKKRFASAKILRHHLEALPIPPAAAREQEAIIALISADREQLEKRIRRLYRLPEENSPF